MIRVRMAAVYMDAWHGPRLALARTDAQEQSKEPQGEGDSPSCLDIVWWLSLVNPAFLVRP